MNVRKGTPDDVESVFNIESRVFSDPWEKDQILDELSNEAYVLSENDGIIGYMMIHRNYKEIQIANFAVDIPYQHKGFGKLFLSEFLSTVNKGNSVTLEVKQSNLNAIKLYIDTGFKEVGRRDEYYADGEAAIVFQLNT